MPRDLFSQTLITEARQKRSRWTVAGSFLVHCGLVAILVIVPIVSGVTAPAIASRLDRFIVTTALPPTPPPPQPAAPRPAVSNINPDAAPVAATANPPDVPAVASSPGTPDLGVIPVVGGQGPMLSRDAGVRIDTAPPAPPRPPQPPQPVRPGGAIKTPQRVSYAPPVYPHIAQVAKVEGVVILEATIDETGTVRDVRVLRSIPMLDAAAVDAVSRWRYTPTLLNGSPVPILLTVTVAFQLR